MADEERMTRAPQRRSPDLPGDTQPAIREDLGTSMGRPRQDDYEPPDRVEPTGGHGPAGAGRVPGRGKLGSHQQPDAGAGEGEGVGG